MNRKEIAKNNFTNGYNCAQSVVLAFSDLLDADEKTLSKAACSSGGGIGRLREVCGSISGMAIVLGLLYGYEGSGSGDVKKEHYERIQEVAKAFEEKNGSIVCRELLNLNVKHDDATPEARTSNYYKKRPCAELVADAAEILDEYIASHPYK